MSLLGELLRSYYAWLILGWAIGAGVLLGGAGTALAGRWLWHVVAAPSLALATPTAERFRVPGAGYRYTVAVENAGRRAAADCRAALRLVGTHPESGAIVRATQPVGWLTPETGDGIDPEGLARSLTLPAGGRARLYLGHTTTTHYQFVFPDLPTVDGEVVRAGPGVEGAVDDRRLPFRDLNETTWRTARLELLADGETARFPIAFDAELAAQDPRLRFEEGTAEGGVEPSATEAGAERDRAT